jgi:hypothetical protein
MVMISLERLPLAAMFVLANWTLLRLAILAAAAVSDWADGALGRRSNLYVQGAIMLVVTLQLLAVERPPLARLLGTVPLRASSIRTRRPALFIPLQRQ